MNQLEENVSLKPLWLERKSRVSIRDQDNIRSKCRSGKSGKQLISYFGINSEAAIMKNTHMHIHTALTDHQSRN